MTAARRTPVASAAATAAPVTVTAAAPVAAMAPVAAATAATATRRKEIGRGRGEAGHAGGIDDYLALRTGAEALAADFRLTPESEVDDAALAAVHGVEAEGLPGALHLLRSGLRAQAQLLDAEQAIVVGVERNAR